MRVKAFRALLPPPELAARVASVPYDTINAEEARALAEGNPDSFLRVIRPEIELPPSTDPYAEEVYDRAAANFHRLQREGRLARDERACLYLYRQRMGDHVQRGVVACCHVEDSEQGLVKKHERTRYEKEEDRTRHVLRLEANAGPVFLTYRDEGRIDALVSEVEGEAPYVEFEAEDGIEHALWRIAETEELVAAFEDVPAFYVADGHHRTAAAERASSELRAKNPAHTGEEEYNWFLCVLFPATQLQVLAYNRCVTDLKMGVAEFLEAVRERFRVREVASPIPDAPHDVSMYVGGAWYGLSWGEEDADPVARLDVSVLQERLLSPVLGVEDPRSDPRIQFVGGIRGAKELERRVDGGEAEVAFSMYPVTIDQVMRVADAGRNMPPKSTWFEPKLRSGLVVHKLSDSE